MRDLACELRLQRGLAALRHTGEVEGREPFAFGVMERDRAAGGPAPAGFVAPVLADDLMAPISEKNASASRAVP